MEFPSPVSMRRPCFAEPDDGLVSIAEMEAGFSGNNNNNNISYHYPHNQTMMMMRRNSLKNLSSSLPSTTVCFSPRSGRLYDDRFEEPPHSPHFLESCFLCHKPLTINRDIFMYRGDTPFCSEECRQEQIEIDEAKEKKLKFKKALRTKKEATQTTPSSSPPTKNHFRTGAVAAA